MRHVAFLLLAAVSTASAQSNPPARDGIWFGAGAGYASVAFVCDSCPEFDREGGPVVFLKAGGTVAERTLMGLEFALWRKDVGGSKVTVTQVSATGTFYMTRQSGFFMKIGGGFSTYNAKGGSEFEGLGGGFTIGAGYDIRLTSGVSITPTAGYLHGDVDDIKVDGITQDAAWRQSMLHVGVGVTFH